MSAVLYIMSRRALYNLQMLFTCAFVFFSLSSRPSSAFCNLVELALLEGLLRADMKVLLRIS